MTSADFVFIGFAVVVYAALLVWVVFFVVQSVRDRRAWKRADAARVNSLISQARAAQVERSIRWARISRFAGFWSAVALLGVFAGIRDSRRKVRGWTR